MDEFGDSDLEDLASEISGKDDLGLGLDVDLQYVSPQLGHFNRLSPLDVNNTNPWSRNYEERGHHRTPSARLSASPSINTTPFLRLRSGSSVGSPDMITTSFFKTDGDSPQVNGKSPSLPRQGSSGRVPGAELSHREPRKPILMQPPLPRAKSAGAPPSGNGGAPAPVQKLLKESDSPIAMKRTARKPIPPLSTAQQTMTTRQRAPIPPSPTLPRRESAPVLPRRTSGPSSSYYGLEETMDAIPPARLHATLCSLQSAASLPPQQVAPPKINSQMPAWPNHFMHRSMEPPPVAQRLFRTHYTDPNLNLYASEALQKLVLIDRFSNDRLPELASPALPSGASPFVDRSRVHEPRPLAIAENPGEKKLDRLRRRREIHSAVERRRRDITNGVLNQLAVLVTAKTMPECKMSKSEILQTSVKHILQAHRVLGEFATEIARLQPNNPLLVQYEGFLEGLANEEEVAKSAAVKPR